MKKIAIFASGSGEATYRVVSLFNEGNRLRTVVVVGDDSSKPLLERVRSHSVTALHIPDEEWENRSPEIATLLKMENVSLIVLDNFEKPIAKEILEAAGGHYVSVSSVEQAPREVVAALEADLRKPADTPRAEEPKDEEPTLENEWAKSLNIQYKPPRVPVRPPEVPSARNQGRVVNPTPPPRQNPYPGGYPGQYPNQYPNQWGARRPQPPMAQQGYRPGNNTPGSQARHEGRKEGEETPMPPTYLIWSILVTVFCCFIPGILAIIFSSQVSSRYYNGDIEGAWRASRRAELWIIFSVVIGVLGATLYLPFLIISG